MKQILKHILILAFAAGFIGTACENNVLISMPVTLI